MNLIKPRVDQRRLDRSRFNSQLLWLLNDGSSPVDLVQGLKLTASGSNAKANSLGLLNTDSSSFWSASLDTTSFKWPITFLWSGTQVTASTSYASPFAFSTSYNNNQAGFIGNTNSIGYVWQPFGDSSNYNTGLVSIPQNVPLLFAVSFDSATSLTLYAYWTPTTSYPAGYGASRVTGISSTIGGTTGSTIYLGNTYGGSNNVWQGQHYWAGIVGQALNAEDVGDLWVQGPKLLLAKTRNRVGYASTSAPTLHFLSLMGVGS